VVLERGSDVGGTWRDNTYPGCACDIVSHLYSFSFELNPDWTRMYPHSAGDLELSAPLRREVQAWPIHTASTPRYEKPSLMNKRISGACTLRRVETITGALRSVRHRSVEAVQPIRRFPGLDRF